MKKISLIIGGHRGIGKSILTNLTKRGDQVFCISRTKILKKNFIQADITSNDGEKEIIKFFKKYKINNLIFAQRYRGKNNQEEYDVILKATAKIIKYAKFKKNSNLVNIKLELIVFSQQKSLNQKTKNFFQKRTIPKEN